MSALTVEPMAIANGVMLERIAQQARLSPHEVALSEVRGARTRRSMTRAAFVTRVRALMGGLQARGFATGDRVLFSVRPGIDAVALVVAVYELGGVLIPQDPGVADVLFAERMKLLEPKWVIAESVLLVKPDSVLARLMQWPGVALAPLGTVEQAQFVHVGPRLPGMPTSIGIERVISLGQQANALLRIMPSRTDTPGLDDDAFIVCTSGTTSAPKAVVHTRQSLGAILAAVEAELELERESVVYSKDLHLLLPALSVGARVVMPRDLGFSGARALDAIERHQVTHAFLVTRDCRVLLDACLRSGRRVPASLQSLMIGAAPVRAPFLERLRTVLPLTCNAWCVYGATEVLPIARVSLEEKVAWNGVGDLVGAPIEGVTVHVRDDGQLVVRGERLCRGYAGGPPMTEYVTGDLAVLHDGLIVLRGRAKDMLIRGDHNIYPELYEPIVERIAGVRRAAIVGDFDPVLADERVVLVVEAEPRVEVDALRERVARALRTGPHRLDRAAQPDHIVIARIPESGRSGKIDKAALRATLGLRDAGVA